MQTTSKVTIFVTSAFSCRHLAQFLRQFFAWRALLRALYGRSIRE
jgi:hypothetical protein